MDKKLESYLNEKRINKNEFYWYVENAIVKAIDEWERKNLGPLKEWESPNQRKEFYRELAEGLLNFATGMKRGIK